MSDISSRSSSKSKKDEPQSSNCKVYVSNIHRDATEQEVRQLFDKFGGIVYFVMKRKPNQVVYAFIQYQSHENAQQAVNQMNRTPFHQRTLNVQFGRGGKHQQQHYETITLIPPKNRDFHERPRSEFRGRYQRQSSPRGDHRPNNYRFYKPKQYDNKRHERSVSPGQYRERRRDNSRQHGGRYPTERLRQFDDRDVKRKAFDEQKYYREQKKHVTSYSPQDERKYYDDVKRHQQRPSKDIDYRRRQKYGHQELSKSEKPKYYDERENSKGYRRKDQDYELQKNRYRQQRHGKSLRRQRESSPYAQKYQRAQRQEGKKLSRDYQKQKYVQKQDYERGRQYKRSRSRQKSSHKHKSHRRQKDRHEDIEYRQRTSKYEKQYEVRGKVRSPYRIGEERRQRRNQFTDQREPYQYKRYVSQDDYRRQNFSRQDSSKYRQKGKNQDNYEIYKKSSRRQNCSVQKSPQGKRKQKKGDSQGKYRFSSERQMSPQNKENKGDYLMDVQKQNGLI